MNHTFTLAPVGCVLFYFRPNWTDYNLTFHSLFEFSNAAGDVLHFWKSHPVNDGTALPWPEYIFAGIMPAGGGDWRVVIDTRVAVNEDSKIFRAVEGAWWQVTWDATNGEAWLFKNGANVGGMYGLASLHVPFTVPVFSKLRIGGDGTAYTANGDIGEFAIFDYHLSDQQREDMLLTGIAGASPAPTFWIKILGDESPEPAEIGPDMTVVGAPPKASFAHPTFRSVPPVITPAIKPAVGTPINAEHPLSEDLIWAIPFNEGTGLPRESVSGVTATLESTGIPGPGSVFVWEPDGSFHFINSAITDALRWDDVTVFDGLRAFTLCFSMTLDLYTWASGDQFAFPNVGYPMIFGKQFCAGYSAGEDSKSVFAFTLNHDDEVEATNHHLPAGSHLGKGSGGRWGFWSMTGKGEGPPNEGGFPELEGIDTLIQWRTSWFPWTDRFRQMFFIYDVDAPPGETWQFRVNGHRHYPGNVVLDAPQPLETTDAPFVVGAMNVSPFPLSGGIHGRFQYIYIWQGAKPDAWEALLDDPFAMYRFGSITMEVEPGVFTLGGDVVLTRERAILLDHGSFNLTGESVRFRTALIESIPDHRGRSYFIGQ